MKILIVDDEATNRLVLKFLLEADGHECIEAENGIIGLEKFKQHEPDFVLMDIIMPEMDGYETTRKLKELTPEQYVPVIFLTAKQDEASLLKCLESGGDDFLTKPFNDIMLKAKIRAHGRTRELTSQMVTKNDELTYLHNALQEEYRMGEHVINHASGRNIKNCPNIRSLLRPVSYYNGDILLTTYKPNGSLCLFLGDFTGHGLAASIGVVPLAQTFFSLCEKGRSASETICEINTVLKEFLPAHMFCAGALLEMSSDGKTIMYWSGGLPTAYIVRGAHTIAQELPSTNIPLGIVGSSEFKDKVDVYGLEEGDSLCLMSDGFLESENIVGDMYGEELVKASISQGEGELFDRLLASYDKFTEGAPQFDDISVVEILAQPLNPPPSAKPLMMEYMPWKLESLLTPCDLKENTDPVSTFIMMLPDKAPFSSHRDLIRTVLTELFSNSLEHGLLGLSSELKESADGFAKYYSLRAERLAQLSEGEIRFSLEAVFEGNVQKLRVRMKDTGEGFDISSLPDSQLEKCWGRGLKLVYSLCENVSFNNKGTEVEATYSLE